MNVTDTHAGHPAPGSDAGRHVPAAIRLTETYADGRDALHCTFEYLAPPTVRILASPGQFFMLNVPGAGECAFTYSALPDEQGRFAALIRRTGTVTSALFALPAGCVLGARGPFGTGWPLAAMQGERVLVVGGGCGLAPLVAAVRALHGRTASVAVLYSARDEHAQVLQRERAQWARDGIALLEVLDAPHAIGPVPHLDRVQAMLGGTVQHALTCGPEAMMFALAHSLVQRGVPGEHIHLSLERRMHCGTGHCGHCYIGGGYCCTDGPVMNWPRVRALLGHPGH